jgi:hypothetical protein
MRKYIDRADQLTGASRNLARLSHVLGADTPSTSPTTSSTREFLREIGASRPRDVEDGFGTLAGAAVGGYFGNKKKHPILGVIGGASLARNVPALMNPGTRGPATRNLLTTGAGLGAAYYTGKHPWYVQVLAFIGGQIAGSLAGSATGLFDE